MFVLRLPLITLQKWLWVRRESKVRVDKIHYTRSFSRRFSVRELLPNIYFISPGWFCASAPENNHVCDKLIPKKDPARNCF